LHGGDKYANTPYMKNTRPVSWIKAAWRDFQDFPDEVQSDMLSALTIVAEGEMPDKAKPFKGALGACLRLLFSIAEMLFELSMP